MTTLGESILALRKDGLTYNEIVVQLKCSKSTVSYYCNETTKLKSKEQNKKWKEDNKTISKLMQHCSNFWCRTKGSGKNFNTDWNKKIRTTVSMFRTRKGMNVENKYTYRDAIEHLGGLQTKCYLTGTPIDLEVDDYCLDHITPVDKDGTNELDNMGITIPEANASKTNLTVEEYLDLCKKVLCNFGYTIIDPE